MPLVPAKCPSCGGDMQIDGSYEEVFCPYCGSQFLVESGVAYYNAKSGTKNEYHIEHADINMEDSRGLETRLANAESYLVQHKDYKKAAELFKAITEEFAGDWRGWWGVVRAITHEFTGIDTGTVGAISFALHGPGSNGVDRVKSLEVASDAFRAVLSRVEHFASCASNVMDAETRQANYPIWEQFKEKYLRVTREWGAGAFELLAARWELGNTESLIVTHQLSIEHARLSRSFKKQFKAEYAEFNERLPHLRHEAERQEAVCKQYYWYQFCPADLEDLPTNTTYSPYRERHRFVAKGFLPIEDEALQAETTAER